MDILEIRRRAKERQQHKARPPEPAAAPAPDPSSARESPAPATVPKRSRKTALPAPAEVAATSPRPEARPRVSPPAVAAAVPTATARAQVVAPTTETDDEGDRVLAEFFASDRDAAINRFADPTLFSSARVFGRTSADSTRYLTCRVGTEEYGIELSRTREILKPLQVTQVPRAPAEVLGVISLRGQVLPVLDLTRRLGAQPGGPPGRTERYVVLTLLGELLCIRVDAVSGVVGFSAAEVEPPPKKLRGLDTDAVAGIGRIDERMIILLRIEELVNALLQEYGGGA